MKHVLHCAIVILFFTIILAAGCTGAETTAGNTNSSADLVSHTVTPPSYAPEECPIPTLIFNNSQEMTVLHDGLVIAEAGDYPDSDGYPIPVGSIIYHSSGPVTRIFDPTGKQILIVNDSESYVTTNGGYVPATTHIQYSMGNPKIVGLGKYISYDINESDKNHPCIDIIIFSNWTNPFLPSHQFVLGR